MNTSCGLCRWQCAPELLVLSTRSVFSALTPEAVSGVTGGRCSDGSLREHSDEAGALTACRAMSFGICAQSAREPSRARKSSRRGISLRSAHHRDGCLARTEVEHGGNNRGGRSDEQEGPACDEEKDAFVNPRFLGAFRQEFREGTSVLSTVNGMPPGHFRSPVVDDAKGRPLELIQLLRGQ